MLECVVYWCDRSVVVTRLCVKVKVKGGKGGNGGGGGYGGRMEMELKMGMVMDMKKDSKGSMNQSKRAREHRYERVKSSKTPHYKPSQIEYKQWSGVD